MHSLIIANIHFLDQAERLVSGVANRTYTSPVGNFYSSTLGQHLRHCLDHYRSFLSGLGDGRIDYDSRERSRELECSTEFAICEITGIRDELCRLTDDDLPSGVLVKLDCGAGSSDYQPSTPGRELQFLVSHTVHHFAMVGGLCSCLNIQVEQGFGVAPSTLRHRETASID